EDSIKSIELDSFDNDEDDDNEYNINPNSAILEIRSGAGGDEAGLFAHDLFRMYMRFFEIIKWKTEILSESLNEIGGIKTATIEVRGKEAFNLLKNESGVHRVQRVPVTESAGRVHTSAAS
ncbi:PCRF domain-containing protein, partial [Arthrospira platensis SPKY2]